MKAKKAKKAKAKAKMRSLTLIGRRWFRRGPGVTYSSVEIVIDGEFRHKIGPFSGYGDHYQTVALDWLVEEGILDIPKCETLWRFCDEHEIERHFTVSDVAREKDL